MDIVLIENEMKKILEEIKELYTDENITHEKLATLWNKYYILSHTSGITLDEAYNTYLLGENVSYILNCNLNYNKDLLKPIDVIEKVIENNPLTMDEANTLLRWVVNDTWYTFEKLGLDLTRNSLCGYCDFGQLNSLYPLEKLGLKVTKNTTEKCFDTYYHHSFGTVTMKIIDNDEVMDKTFLVDTTYKQFFTSIRCNSGRYYTKNEDYGVDGSPDCGFFMETDYEKNMSTNLITNGFILLSSDVAKIYGEGFKKSCIPLNKSYLFDELDKINFNYYKNTILSKFGNYSMSELDFIENDFTLDCCELPKKI